MGFDVRAIQPRRRCSDPEPRAGRHTSISVAHHPIQQLDLGRGWFASPLAVARAGCGRDARRPGPVVFPVSSLVATGDWFRSGVPMRFPPLKIAMSGRGIGWVPMLASADPHSDSTWPDTQQVMHERTGNLVPDRDHR